MNYFKYAINLINQAKQERKTVFWHYNLMGVGELIRYNPRGKTITMIDIMEEKVYLKESLFNKYNVGTDPRDIIKIR